MDEVMSSKFSSWIVMDAVMYFLNSYNIFRNVVAKLGCVTEDDTKEETASVVVSVEVERRGSVFVE